MVSPSPTPKTFEGTVPRCPLKSPPHGPSPTSDHSSIEATFYVALPVIYLIGVSSQLEPESFRFQVPQIQRLIGRGRDEVQVVAGPRQGLHLQLVSHEGGRSPPRRHRRGPCRRLQQLAQNLPTGHVPDDEFSLSRSSHGLVVVQRCRDLGHGVQSHDLWNTAVEAAVIGQQVKDDESCPSV